MSAILWVVAGALVVGAALLLLARVRAARRQRTRAEYARRLQQALEDGILTEEEVAELEAFRAEAEVTHAEARMVALAIYRRAVADAAADDRLTEEEDVVLQRLARQLNVRDGELGEDARTLERLRALARIEAGNLPLVESPVPLAAGERCYWVRPCTLANRLGIGLGTGHSAVEEPHGRTYRVAGGEAYHPGGGLDALRPSPRILPSDLGILVVTDRRVVLRGARRTISVAADRIVSVTAYRDGLRISDSTGHAHLVLMDEPDVSAAMVLRVARAARAADAASQSA